MTLTPVEHRALAELVRFVRARFGSRVRELALFGSKARGDAHDESDLDVLVAVDDLSNAEGNEIASYCGHPILTEHDVWISTFAVSTAHLAMLRSRERRIAHEIDRDRIELEALLGAAA